MLNDEGGQSSDAAYARSDEAIVALWHGNLEWRENVVLKLKGFINWQQ